MLTLYLVKLFLLLPSIANFGILKSNNHKKYSRKAMLKNAIKHTFKNSDADQKAILWCFVCTTGVTLLGGLIFKGGSAYLLTFIPAWWMFSSFFGRKNKSVKKDGKYIAENGKEFSCKDKILYRLFFFCMLALGILLSRLISMMFQNPETVSVLMLYIPYVGCTIYGFVKKIPLNTFLESSKNYHLDSNSTSFSESTKNDTMTNPIYSYLSYNIHHRNDSF